MKMRSSCSVDPLSSKDVAVVVDFHWFTDCHLEAIFNINTSRFRPRSPITVDEKDVRLTTNVSIRSEPGSARYSSAPSITTVWSNYQTSYNDFFEVYITETVTLSQYIIFKMVFSPVQLSQCQLRDQSFFVLIGQIAFSWYTVMINRKYVNVQASVVGPQ